MAELEALMDIRELLIYGISSILLALGFIAGK